MALSPIQLNLGTSGDLLAADEIAGIKYAIARQAFGPIGTTIYVSTNQPLPIGGTENEGVTITGTRPMKMAGRGLTAPGLPTLVADGQAVIMLMDLAGRPRVVLDEGVVGDIDNDEPDTGTAPVKTGSVARDLTLALPSVAPADRVQFLSDLFGRQVVVMDLPLPAGTNNIGTAFVAGPTASGSPDTSNPLKTGGRSATARPAAAAAGVILNYYTDIYGRQRIVEDQDLAFKEAGAVLDGTPNQVSFALTNGASTNLASVPGPQTYQYQVPTDQTLFIEYLAMAVGDDAPLDGDGFLSLAAITNGIEIAVYSDIAVKQFEVAGSPCRNNGELFAGASSVFVESITGGLTAHIVWKFERPLAVPGDFTVRMTINDDLTALAWLAGSVQGELRDTVDLA